MLLDRFSFIIGTILAGLLANLPLAQASGMGLYYLLGLTVDGFYKSIDLNIISPIQAFKELGELSLFAVFKEGFDFSAYSDPMVLLSD